MEQPFVRLKGAFGMKQEYIVGIIDMLEKCNDLELIALVFTLLKKSQ